MVDEFARNKEWTDWRGKTYTLKDEWAYVKAVATAREGCTPGIRDANNQRNGLGITSGRRRPS